MDSKSKMMEGFDKWLQSEIDGKRIVNVDLAFVTASKKFIAETNNTAAPKVNYSTRSEIKRERDLRDADKWLGRGIGARGDWDI